MSDIELPDLPSNVLNVLGRIRRGTEAPARVVLENALSDFATTAILADREKRAQAAQPMTLAYAAKSFPDGPFGAPVISKPVQAEAPTASAPAAGREPLGDGEIMVLFHRREVGVWVATPGTAFVEGFRTAERYYGIGTKEPTNG